MNRNIDHIIVHCSATEHGKDFSASDIDKWHRARGWLGNGYHFVIRLDGTIESKAKGNRCRPLDKAGAHVGDCGPGWNRRTIGICLIGGLKNGKPSVEYTQAQYDSLYRLINDLDDVFRVGVERIIGHRDLIQLTGAPPKDCPCFDVQEWLAERDEKELHFEGTAPLRSNFE